MPTEQLADKSPQNYSNTDKLLEGNHWTLESDLDLMENISAQIDRRLESLGYSDSDRSKITLMFNEAFTNAVIHGNSGTQRGETETSGQHRQRAIPAAKNSGKKILLETDFKPDVFTFSIQDEGPGFQYNNVANPLAKENVYKTHGRGLQIMSSWGKTKFNEKGNKITVIFEKSRRDN